MRTVAYIRVSTGSQGLESQRLAILDYAHRHGLTVQTFVEAHVSSCHAGTRRSVDTLLEQVHAGDLILVSELSRLGRSVGQVIQLVDRLLKQRVQLVAIKGGSPWPKRHCHMLSLSGAVSGAWPPRAPCATRPSASR